MQNTLSARRRPSPGRASNRGSVTAGCGIALGVIVLGVIVAAVMLVGSYNGIVGGQEGIEASWAEIQNQYKRRFDLVPQLVETVKGAADFEQSVLTEVVEARASVGRAEVQATVPSDPAQLEAYMSAQASLGGALQRLLVVAERYPELKATNNFQTLQDQLEGTENRIAVARRDYIDAVRSYNTRIRAFPGNFMASTFGFEKAAQLEVEAGVTERPVIDFGRDEKDE